MALHFQVKLKRFRSQFEFANSAERYECENPYCWLKCGHNPTPLLDAQIICCAHNILLSQFCTPSNEHRAECLVLSLVFCRCSPPHSPVEAVGTEAMSTLGLKRSSEYVVAAVAQVLVLQLITQDLLGEAGFIALHGRRRGRFLCSHGVCLHVTPGIWTICHNDDTLWCKSNRRVR